MNIAVIFAGGTGTRMHSKERPKQFLEIYNKPIIIHTLEYFEENEDVDAIVVVCVSDWIDYFRSLIYTHTSHTKKWCKYCKNAPLTGKN